MKALFGVATVIWFALAIAWVVYQIKERYDITLKLCIGLCVVAVVLNVLNLLMHLV